MAFSPEDDFKLVVFVESSRFSYRAASAYVLYQRIPLEGSCYVTREVSSRRFASARSVF